MACVQVDASYAMYVHDTMFVPGAIYPKNLTVEDARSVDHVTYARQAQDASRRHLPVGEGLITIVPPRTTMWLSKSKSKFDCGAGGPSAAKERVSENLRLSGLSPLAG